ncbi:hypothetical protein LEP1GSC016_3333 [Leptospira borgpetersenii serovar Hardjo-bovis str. Sponselee]|uniref:Uncharacterized protein n=1 Tax=Leptospira borgpetersenii serovar Hardjo-bovis str. Sponselee TaxID=1303729 RepID=M6BXG0_LEPBO|nr:hypothetical protein LEP1GSC016_3333 [Leptospira borgpetersenii serovar Hardjo-bovis str. Sponselee]
MEGKRTGNCTRVLFLPTLSSVNGGAGLNLRRIEIFFRKRRF